MHEKPVFKKIIDFEEAKELIEQMRRDRGFLCGYKDWDNLSGGLVRDGVTLIAARPAMGKTAFALNVVNRLSQHPDGTILIFSPNLRSREITIRLLNIGTGLEASQLLDGSKSAEELTDKCAEFFQSKKCNIQIETLTAPSLENIWWRCCRIPDLQLLVINNIERICKPYEECTPDVPWYENYEPKDKVLNHLKVLAKELRVPVICTTHLHRSLERRNNKRPHLGDLKKTGYPAELIDQIVFLYRDRYYDPEGEEGAELIVAKVAQGDVGTVRLDWDDTTGRFLERGNDE